MEEILIKYLPEQSIPVVLNWFEEYKFHLKISKTRASKLGDFRPSSKGMPHRISVNGDLNKFHFLITLTHEVAHVKTWIEHGRNALPHGKEWQKDFTELLEVVTQTVDLPKDLLEVIYQHAKSPKASSCSDPKLYKALRKYDVNAEELAHLDELEFGEYFALNRGRVFKKGEKRRTRYMCLDQNSGKPYLISAHAKVKRLK